jgi:hypothetical protein
MLMKTQSPDPAPIQEWSTAGLTRSDTTDAWQAALTANYGEWQVSQAVGNGFTASVRNRDFNGVRVVECVCDPCTGRRLPQFIERAPEPYIGVQITKAGRERFTSATKTSAWVRATWSSGAARNPPSSP